MKRLQRQSRLKSRVCLATPLVAVLLFACCPTAVSRFVVTVVVDTVNAHASIGLPSHVCKESSKAIAPSVTDANPPAAVIFPAFGARYFASANHVYPAAIFRSPVSPACMTVLKLKDGRILAPMATTALRITRAQVSSADKFYSAAIAQTEPDDILVGGSASGALCYQSIKALSGKVQPSHGVSNSNIGA